MTSALRLWLALLAPLLLVGCVVTPGKFTSALVINADRTFTFSYKGEVYAVDTAKALEKGLESVTGEDGSASVLDKPTEPAKADPATERKRAAIAAALARETGYRSATYVGDGKYMIDYAISGVLTHNFLYPYNADADIVTPFIAIELRAGDTLRIRAPGFAAPLDSAAAAQLGDKTIDVGKYLDGQFTLDAAGLIVSQNSETGVAATNGRSTIKWKSAPTTKDAPSAVVKLTR